MSRDYDLWTQGEPLSTEERRLALMAALLLPLRAAIVPLKAKKTQPLPSHILLKSIKWKTSDADGVEVLHREAAVLLHALRQMQARHTSSLPSPIKKEFDKMNFEGRTA